MACYLCIQLAHPAHDPQRPSSLAVSNPGIHPVDFPDNLSITNGACKLHTLLHRTQSKVKKTDGFCSGAELLAQVYASQ